MTQKLSVPVSPNSDLLKSIELLYDAFAKYPLNPKMNGSPVYEHLTDWNQALAAKPLRQLTAEDLEIYHFKTMTTWGNVNDFKHFLPRIFELLSELPIDFDEWVALDKLNYGNYKSWPDKEKIAVYQYLKSFWLKLLTEESSIIDAYFKGYFPAIANVYPDFNQMLQLWLAADNQNANLRLASFVCRHEKRVLKKQTLSGYDDMLYQGKLFYEWLKIPAVLNKLKQTVPSESYPYIDMELIPVVQQLEQQ